MRDAFGGIINISMIVVFLVIVSGYLAFNVSYTKAFRVKNKIITTIEQYEGKCDTNQECYDKIHAYIQQIGYSPAQFDGDADGCTPINKDKFKKDGYFVARCTGTPGSTVGTSSDYRKVYYKVETAIDISIPIVNNIITNMKVFRLTGNTKLIKED